MRGNRHSERNRNITNERHRNAEGTRTMNEKGMERLLNVNDVADMLGIAPKSVYRLVAERKIPYTKPTRMTLRFRRSVIEDWLESRSLLPKE